jgi:hypothetical protein
MVLRKTEIFQTKRPDTSTVEKKITGIEGKPRYFASERSGSVLAVDSSCNFSNRLPLPVRQS